MEVFHSIRITKKLISVFMNSGTTGARFRSGTKKKLKDLNQIDKFTNQVCRYPIKCIKVGEVCALPIIGKKRETVDD